MNYLFPYDNIVAGILIFLIGFCIHWMAQLISVFNWEFATKLGLQEPGMPREYKVYEHASAAADSLIGWIYGIAAIGLFLDESWGYKLAWIPGSILLYHSISFWFWTGNRNRDGNKLESTKLRIVWTIANFITGILTILLAWNAA